MRKMGVNELALAMKKAGFYDQVFFLHLKSILTLIYRQAIWNWPSPLIWGSIQMYQPKRSKNRHVHRWAYTISILFHLILLPLISRVNLEGRRKHIGLITPDRSYVKPILPVELPETVDLVPAPKEPKPLMKEIQLQETNRESSPQQVQSRPKPILAQIKPFL